MKLPPLNALRAFECAARCGSFTVAASELHVTPSAISRHVSQLEAWLGVALFSRLQRRIELTEAGIEYSRASSAVFAMLEKSTRQVMASVSPELRFKLPPTVAFRWLVPQVTQFQKYFPGVSIQIATSLLPVDLQGGEADIEVRAFQKPPENLRATRVFDNELVTVCRPGVLAPRTSAQARFSTTTLLTSQSRRDDWSIWFAGSGVKATAASSGLAFEYSFLAYEAAIEGAGIAVAIKALVDDDLALGRLVYAHPAVVSTGWSYFAVSLDRPGKNKAIDDFHTWLGQNARRVAPKLPR